MYKYIVVKVMINVRFYIFSIELVLYNLVEQVSPMDQSNLLSEEYQRVYHYLSRYRSQNSLDKYLPNSKMKSPGRFIDVIYRYDTHACIAQ